MTQPDAVQRVLQLPPAGSGCVIRSSHGLAQRLCNVIDRGVVHGLHQRIRAVHVAPPPSSHVQLPDGDATRCLTAAAPRPSASPAMTAAVARGCNAARVYTLLSRMAFPVSPSLASVSRHRLIEVVWTAIEPLVRSLRAEGPPLHVQVRQPRGEPGGTQLCAGAARDEFPKRVLRGVQNHLGHDLRRIDRRHGLWLYTEIGASLFEEGRVDARRLDERHGDGHALFFELHPQSVRERLECVFGRTVAALQRDRPIRQRAADVDQRAASVTKVAHGGTRAVDLAPVVDVHLAPHVARSTGP